MCHNDNRLKCAEVSVIALDEVGAGCWVLSAQGVCCHVHCMAVAEGTHASVTDML